MTLRAGGGVAGSRSSWPAWRSRRCAARARRGYPLPPPAERLLYLRSGKAANRVLLSFDALAADIYWIRTIQHYGATASRRDRRLASSCCSRCSI